MNRSIEPEWLDELPEIHPEAMRSRADLRRLNRIMGHARLFSRAFFQSVAPGTFSTRPLRLCELGAGDGMLLLQLARRWSARGVFAEVVMVDRQALVTEQTRSAFEACHWSVTPIVADALEWVRQCSRPVDLICCNLFLHHFRDAQLRPLLQGVAEITNLFIACEPRRSGIALAASHLVGWVGCNRITRHDAVISVHAGFSGREISALWPAGGWEVSENSRGLFSHCFVAKRHVLRQ